MTAFAYLTSLFGLNRHPVEEVVLDYHPDQAAAMPLRVVDGKAEVLLVTSRDTGRWVLPKGWIETDENGAEAARREALEEAGIRGMAEPRPLATFSYIKRRPRRGDRECHVDVYQMAVIDELVDWPEKKQRKRRWFAVEEAADLVEEPQLAQLFRSLARP